MSGKDFRTKLERKKGQKEQLLESIVENEAKIKELERQSKFADESQLVINTVAAQTQKELEFSVSDLVSFSIASIFEDPYKFQLEFNPKRGKTEALLNFYTKEGKEIYDPLLTSGYGVVDIAALGLRFSLWSLRNKKCRNTFILDEPAKHLRGKSKHRKLGEMLRTICSTLNIQIIMISDVNSDEIIEVADRVFTVEKINKDLSKIGVRTIVCNKK